MDSSGTYYMIYSDTAATTCDVKCLGYPHLQCEPQQTDPFWHQYPEWSLTHHEQYHYPHPTAPNPEHPFYIDSSNTSSPSIVGYAPKRPTNKQKHQPTAPRQETIDLYLQNAHITTQPLKTLTRFSRLAANIFPPSNTPPKPLTSNHLDIAHTTPLTTLALPSPAAFSEHISWMHLNAPTRRPALLTPFHVPKYIPLSSLIDLYAAALHLQTKPFPHELRHTLLMRLGSEVLNVHILKAAWELLPRGDVVVRRAVRVCLEQWRARVFTWREDVQLGRFVVRSEGMRVFVRGIWASMVREREEEGLRAVRAREEMRERFEADERVRGEVKRMKADFRGFGKVGRGK